MFVLFLIICKGVDNGPPRAIQSIFIANDMTQEEKTKAIRREAVKKWHANNKDKVKVHTDKWRADNKVNCNVRNLITQAISWAGYKKTTKSETILGCTFEEFRQHLESQFEPWMNWDNYGCKTPTAINMTWDIDHIIPLSSAVTEEDIIRLNHYTNLRPLCSYVNRFVKRSKLF